MDQDTARLLLEFVEKVGLLRRDIQQRKELEKYEGRIARIEGKLSKLAEQISHQDPDLAKALRSVWQLPARSLAFRNADHQNSLPRSVGISPDQLPRNELMAEFVRHAEVDWSGGLLDGTGRTTAGTGAFSLPVTFPSRIAEKGDDKTTPEELLAASHAVCYTMVLTNTITKQGGKVSRIHVTATVTGNKSDAGLKVVSSKLTARVEGLEGIDPSTLQDLATGAEKGCPISNALRGNVAITVDAQAI